MADFDGVIDPIAEWADIPDLSVTAVARGGPSGAMNAQATAITKRLKYLKNTKVEKTLIPFLVKDYFVAGEADSTAMLNRCYAAIPAGGSGAVMYEPGVTYDVSDEIYIQNRRAVTYGNNATINLKSNSDYVFYVDGENCEFNNFSLNKTSGVTAIAPFFLKGLQHTVNNITSRNQKWANFFHARELKESKFLHLDIQLDVSGLVGNVFLLDYCVNNSLGDSFLGFGAALFKGTSATHPTNGYSNEGFIVTNTIGVFFDLPFDAVRFTSLTIGSGCIFDFCGRGGVFVTNGHTLTVAPGVWFATNTTDGFIGVGTGPTFDNAKVVGANFVRNNSVENAIALSLTGTKTTASFNTGLNGMSMGVVTQPATPMSLLANVVDSPGVGLANESHQEGVWTPGLSFGGAAVAIAYASRPAKYVKTGNRIFVEFYIILSNKGTSTGGAVVSGLPFTSDATTNLYVGAGGYLNGVTAAGPLAAFVTPNTKNITLGYGGATGFTQLTNANFTNSTEVSMSFSYTI